MKRTTKILAEFLVIMIFMTTTSFSEEAPSQQTPHHIAINTTKFIHEIQKTKPKVKRKLTSKEQIDIYITKICKKYKIDTSLVKSIVWHESRYNPKAKTGSCVGLMQISTRWHKRRANKLGVTDFYDPYSNILIGVDYLSDIFRHHKDPALVLMLYNMDNNTALRLYKQGIITNYAKSVLAMAKKLG